MKYYQFIIILLTAFVVIMTGCEYDVKKPLWEQPYSYPPETKITRIEPESIATAGVNYITIHGENFAQDLADNQVYFSYLDENNNEVVVGAEIVDGATTWLKVRRPNISHNAMSVKVVSYDAILVATYPPEDSLLYQIDPVMERYGEFLDNNQLRGLSVDDEENLYVLQDFEHTVYKVPPGEAKIGIGSIEGTAYDCAVAPDGKLVIAFNQTYLNKLDMETGEDTLFLNVPKRVSFCDYDDYGMLYVIGRKSDLIVISPDSSNQSIGVYADYIITGMRVYNNYIYIVGENTDAGPDEVEFGIWRHQILDASGNLGNQELMLDWAAAGEAYADSEPTGVAVTQDGTMYVGCDNENPILIVTPDGQIDVFYKDIIPAHAVKLIGGTSNYIYMILGIEEYNIIRIDTGNE